MGWTLERGLTLVRELAPILLERGWGIGLTGSVLLEGKSRNDLDIIAYPQTRVKGNISELEAGMRLAGLRLKYDIKQVHAAWRRQGSQDDKLVQVWQTRTRQKVDLFIMD